MKTLKRVLSVVVALTMLMSMMTLTVLADNTATIDVTYYTDAAMGTVATKVAPGESVYALLTLNLPQTTFKSSNLDVTVTNATLAAEANGTLWDAVLNSEMAGRLERATGLPGQNALGNFAISKVLDASKPWDSEWDENANIASETVPLILYKLDVADGATGNVSVAVTGSLDIGYYDEDEGANFPTPFTVNVNSLPIESAAADPVITYSYDATIASTKVDPESATYEDDVKALVTVTKTTLSDGTATGTETVAAKELVVDKAATTVTVTFPDDTTKVLNYTEMLIAYRGLTVELGSSFDYNVDADSIVPVVTAIKTKDGVDAGTFDLVEGTDYDVVVTFDADANTGKAVVTFKGAYAAETAVEKTFTRTDAPVSYKDVVATISGSPFAFGTTEDQIKTAIAVKGTKVEGVVETANVTVPADLYEITVDLANGTAVVTMDGTTIDTLTFDISEETFTYSDYAVVYTGEDEYDYTVDADTIAALVKVTATKTGESTPAETVDLTNEVDVVVDKDAGTITVTWKAGSAHAAETIDGAVRNVTFNDVIEYKNVSASLSKTSFASDATDDEIKGFLTVSIEEFVNDVKNDNFVADYNVTVDRVNNKVIVEFADEYGVEDIEIGGITFLATGTVTLKVEAATNVTEGVVDISGAGAATEFTAVVKVEGLDTRVMTGADLAISATAGELKSVAVVDGSNYNIPEGAIASNVWTGKINKVDGAANLANGLLVVTVDAAGVADTTKIKINVDSATLYMVDVANNDYTTIPNIAEALEVEVKAFERNVEAVTVDSFDIGIITLGPVTDAKFVNGVSLAAEDGTKVDLTGKVTLNSTTRKIQVAELTLPVSATKDEVKYTLKVEVAGYTTIEEEIVVSYNGEDTNDWSVTNPITANSAIYAGNVNSINAIEADDYITIIQAYGEAAAYDIYEGGATIDLNDIMTTVYMIDTYGMQEVTAAGIIE